MVERWRDARSGDLLTKLIAIARALKEAAPAIVKQVEEGRERQRGAERLSSALPRGPPRYATRNTPTETWRVE